MSATELAPISVEEMRQRVRELAADVRERSAEFEHLNDLPQDVFEAIGHSGVTRTCVPRELGGLEGTLLDWFSATSELAEADAAAAWIVAQGVVQNAWLAIFADTEFARSELANPLALPATSINGKATLRPLEGGDFELSGQWRFLSGSSGATLIGGLAVVVQEDVAPEFRFVMVPVSEAIIEKNWDNVGLRGTGSHNARVGPMHVPQGQTWLFGTGTPRFEHPYSCFGAPGWPITISSAAVQLGIARRTLDETRTVMATKPQLMVHAGTTAPLATNPAVQRAIARAEGIWRSARAGVVEALTSLWSEAQSGRIRPSTIQACQLACATAVWQCADVITTGFNLAGTTGQTGTHALQRCFRDGHVLTAHISVNDGLFEAIGRAMLTPPASAP